MAFKMRGKPVIDGTALHKHAVNTKQVEMAREEELMRQAQLANSPLPRIGDKLRDRLNRRVTIGSRVDDEGREIVTKTVERNRLFGDGTRRRVVDKPNWDLANVPQENRAQQGGEVVVGSGDEARDVIDPPLAPEGTYYDPSDDTSNMGYDDMSFKDAFGRARAELGPDGTFIWRGKEYNTRLAEDNKPAPGDTRGPVYDIRPGDPGYGVYKVPDKQFWPINEYKSNPNFPIPGTVNAPYEINPPYDWMRDDGAYPGGSSRFNERTGEYSDRPMFSLRTAEVVQASDGTWHHPSDVGAYEASLRGGSSSRSSSGSWSGAMGYRGMK